MGGQAAIFTPPTIHKSNVVIFPRYLAKNRLKNFAKLLKAKFTINQDGLVTVANDSLDFHYQPYAKYIQLVEITLDNSTLVDASRCIEFLRYESYLLQKPIFCDTTDPLVLQLLEGQGFRILRDHEERDEAYSSLWEEDLQKVF